MRRFFTPSGSSRVTELPSSYFRCERCIGGKSTAAPRVNLFLPFNHDAKQAASTVFSIFAMSQPGIEPSQAAFVGRVQPTLPFIRF